MPNLEVTNTLTSTADSIFFLNKLTLLREITGDTFRISNV